MRSLHTYVKSNFAPIAGKDIKDSIEKSTFTERKDAAYGPVLT